MGQALSKALGVRDIHPGLQPSVLHSTLFFLGVQAAAATAFRRWPSLGLGPRGPSPGRHTAPWPPMHLMAASRVAALLHSSVTCALACRELLGKSITKALRECDDPNTPVQNRIMQWSLGCVHCAWCVVRVRE
jgi:hypothetical protein